jgi:hypothetical protein
MAQADYVSSATHALASRERKTIHRSGSDGARRFCNGPGGKAALADAVVRRCQRP